MLTQMRNYDHQLVWEGDLQNTVDAVLLDDYKEDGDNPEIITHVYNGWIEDIAKALEIMKY